MTVVVVAVVVVLVVLVVMLVVGAFFVPNTPLPPRSSPPLYPLVYSTRLRDNGPGHDLSLSHHHLATIAPSRERRRRRRRRRPGLITRAAQGRRRGGGAPGGPDGAGADCRSTPKAFPCVSVARRLSAPSRPVLTNENDLAKASPVCSKPPRSQQNSKKPARPLAPHPSAPPRACVRPPPAAARKPACARRGSRPGPGSTPTTPSASSSATPSTPTCRSNSRCALEGRETRAGGQEGRRSWRRTLGPTRLRSVSHMHTCSRALVCVCARMHMRKR